MNFNLSKNKRLKIQRILLFNRINRHSYILGIQIFKVQVPNWMSIEAFNIEMKKFIKNLHVDNYLKDIIQALVNKLVEKKNST